MLAALRVRVDTEVSAPFSGVESERDVVVAMPRRVLVLKGKAPHRHAMRGFPEVAVVYALSSQVVSQWT